MSERFAVANGNASSPATWNGGTIPTAADDVYSNNFTVTIDVNCTWLSARNLAGSSAVAGGSFVLSDGKTLRANVFAGTANCVTYSGAVGQSAFIVGNVTGGTGVGSGASAVGGGTLTITGNAIGGTDGFGTNCSGNSTIIINGNATGGNSTSFNAGAGALTSSGTTFIHGYAIGHATGFGPGAQAITTGLTVVKKAKCGASGCFPVVGPTVFDNEIATTIEMRDVALAAGQYGSGSPISVITLQSETGLVDATIRVRSRVDGSILADEPAVEIAPYVYSAEIGVLTAGAHLVQLVKSDATVVWFGTRRWRTTGEVIPVDNQLDDILNASGVGLGGGGVEPEYPDCGDATLAMQQTILAAVEAIEPGSIIGTAY